MGFYIPVEVGCERYLFFFHHYYELNDHFFYKSVLAR